MNIFTRSFLAVAIFITVSQAAHSSYTDIVPTDLNRLVLQRVSTDPEGLQTLFNCRVVSRRFKNDVEFLPLWFRFLPQLTMKVNFIGDMKFQVIGKEDLGGLLDRFTAIATNLVPNSDSPLPLQWACYRYLDIWTNPKHEALTIKSLHLQAVAATVVLSVQEKPKFDPMTLLKVFMRAYATIHDPVVREGLDRMRLLYMQELDPKQTLSKEQMQFLSETTARQAAFYSKEVPRIYLEILSEEWEELNSNLDQLDTWKAEMLEGIDDLTNAQVAACKLVEHRPEDFLPNHNVLVSLSKGIQEKVSLVAKKLVEVTVRPQHDLK